MGRDGDEKEEILGVGYEVLGGSGSSGVNGGRGVSTVVRQAR